MTTTIKQLNTLITKVFGDNEDWIKSDIQNQLKKILGDKKKKDPNAPKRSKTAYLFYCDDHRQSVREQLGETATFPEVIQQVASNWNKLNSDAENKNKKAVQELKKYHERAEKDKARYLEEQKNYVPPVGIGTPTKKTVKRKNTSPSGYMLFCKHYRQTHPDKTCTFKEIGEAWTELEDSGKSKFNKQALELKENKVVNTTEDDSSETATTTKSNEVKDEKPKKVTKSKSKK